MMRRAWILVCALLATAPPASAGLSEALDAVRARDWETAEAEARRGGRIEVAIVEWHRLRAGDGDFDDYLAFQKTYGDWPGMPLLLRRGELNIPANADAAEVITYFADQKPQTDDGVLRYALALETLGKRAEAEAFAVQAWKTMNLSDLTESTLLARYGQALAPYHIERMDTLLWRGRLVEAERMRPRVPEGWRRLYDARAALRRDEPGVDLRIAAVPADLSDDPGLAWERMEWRARRGRMDDAVALILDRSVSTESLGRPEAWAPRRREYARDLMRDGDARTAYLVASQHYLTEGADFADLEWLSGYLALQKLDSPGAALSHFRHFRAGVQGPISLGRAGYWEGRAHEAMDQPAQALTAYAFGAEFQTSFYGQLAAERAGLPMDPLLLGGEVFPVPRDNPFDDLSVYQAAMALDAAGDLTLSARFFAHLSERLDRGQIGQLLTLTEALGEPYIQLQIAKRAASFGITLHRAYFPMMDISTAGRPDVAPELALAIARRESEFNPTVISPAGARGLMQVMPGTASDTAKALGIPYTLSRLTSDPAYNALLGTAYLQKLDEQFGDAVILVAAGYNAGPGRPPQWIAAFGDPRRDDIDAVDWIETIPYRETRNYVMRVTEALAPYRAQLAGHTVPLTLSKEIEAR